ncbi:dTDP-4-dehydrorhamnose 3,5-epimerase [Tissierella creatinini]|nr:dTDP-4-dehydrorhamnose 3,5-epimerase [Tissierella creatinini]TJX61550.1 dTDP-4-dehydrorhamnose 3,5-epimerase [Soehngenia saccharolytica]
MKITELEIKGVKILEPEVFEDFRGSYSESYSARTLMEYGIDNIFVQDNHIKSIKKGTLRGIHYQNNPKSQTKLLRCTRGKILDIVVDLRKDSTTYKKWLGVELSEENNKQIWIPNGFGHGLLTLTDNCEILYKVDEFYEPNLDRVIAWNDPDINIDWPIDNPILSSKDKNAPLLKDSDCNLNMEVNK